jgi:hypothetical protein
MRPDFVLLLGGDIHRPSAAASNQLVERVVNEAGYSFTLVAKQRASTALANWRTLNTAKATIYLFDVNNQAPPQLWPLIRTKYWTTLGWENVTANVAHQQENTRAANVTAGKSDSRAMGVSQCCISFEIT